MADAIDIIISAVDSASEVFQSIISSAQSMADGIGGAVESTSAEFDNIASNVENFQDAVSNVDDTELMALADTLGMDTEEVERLLATGADIGGLSAGFNEAAIAADDLETEIREDTEAMDELGSAGDVMAAQTFMDMANGMKDSMLGMADTAGTFNDSLMRAGLEAEGAGHSVEDMTNVVNTLSETTGRAGGQIRESFITATARGVTDLDSFQKMMEGAGAQATLFGTDIQSMANSFSGLAAKATISEKFLANMGITMDELGEAMGMTGATSDEVKSKWKELDTNQRAAALGMAASLNEGKNANEEYKTSWAGLGEQLNIAKSRLERIVGSVLLPVLIPAMQLAGTILNGVGDVIQGIMNGPLGGLVSVLGSLAGVFIIGVTGAAALRNMLAFLKIETILDSAASWLNTAAKVANGEASVADALANEGLAASFMTSAAAAFEAAIAFMAATWPLWVIVGAVVAVIAIIYELGKAWGWWTDASSMLEAVQAGLQRLWDAFINHPDVQAVITALSEAWDIVSSAIGNVMAAISEFFGLNTGGDFDIVRALIDGIGAAWNAIRQPIIMIINTFRLVLTVLTELMNGNISATAAIGMIWNAFVNTVRTILTLLFSVFRSIWNRILAFVVQLVNNLVSRVVNYFRQLNNRIRSVLMNVVSGIRSAIQAWITVAVAKVHEWVNKVTSPFRGVASKISSALSSVKNAIMKPFEDAWNAVSPYLDKIKEGIDTITSLGGAFGGETDGVSLVTGVSKNNTDTTIVSDNKTKLTGTLTIVHELKDLPETVTAAEVAQLIDETTSSDGFVRKIAESKVFQKYDLNVKQSITGKNRRARGV